MSKLKVGLVQLLVTSNKEKNVTRALKMISKCKEKNCDLVVLPESFNSPYGELQTSEGIETYAEDMNDSETLSIISEIAKKEKINIVAGSIPTVVEKNNVKNYFNTSVTFSSEGKILGTHNKIHLFDINIPGKIVYEESKMLTGGSNLTYFEIPEKPEFKIGVGICFDVRFAELAQIYRKEGCNLLIYPGAFNLTTGPAHWKHLAIGRALDNQLFTALCSPARDEDASYVAYGHSMIVNPWGEILEELDEKEGIIIQDINLEELETMRKQLPVVSSKDKFYETKFKKKCDI